MKVVIDGVFFQMYQTGIARVWTALLETWAADGFAEHIVLLDRGGTSPVIAGVRRRGMEPYDYSRTDRDRQILQMICDEEGADVFISTYYTTPLSTPSVFMAHDMIPEIFGWDLRHPMWREKHLGIAHASAFVCVSEATRRDLLRLVPRISAEKVHVTPLAAAELFRPRSAEEIEFVRNGTGLSRSYFLTVGARGGYKNTILTFRALAQYPRLAEFDIFCAGHVTLEPEYQALLPGKDVKAFNLSDDELAAAYSGAVALLHPSTYEGFGLPVLEAMACGCPVITTKNGSLAEVAGDAAIFVADDDVAGMAAALEELQKPEVRERMIAAGLEQARKFSWQKTADGVKEVLLEVARQGKLRAGKDGS
jgi:glycosyltransferase involved in cell wall biosynthesis